MLDINTGEIVTDSLDDDTLVLQFGKHLFRDSCLEGIRSF